MSVLPHQNRTAVPPRGLSVAAETFENQLRRKGGIPTCIDVSLCHRSINPPSVTTCSSVAAVPEGPSVPLLTLKVSLSAAYPCARHESSCLLKLCFDFALFRALHSRGTFLPHTELPSTPTTSRPNPCPGNFIKSQQAQRGAGARARFCSRFGPLLPICRVVRSGAGAAG